MKEQVIIKDFRTPGKNIDTYTKEEIDEIVLQLTSNLILTVNPLTYILTATLLNKDEEEIASKSIDLPLEEMIISIDYDSETKEIIFELKSGEVRRVPVGDIISGLVDLDTFNNTIADLEDAINELQNDISNKQDKINTTAEDSGKVLRVDSEGSIILDSLEDLGDIPFNYKYHLPYYDESVTDMSGDPMDTKNVYVYFDRLLISDMYDGIIKITNLSPDRYSAGGDFSTSISWADSPSATTPSGGTGPLQWTYDPITNSATASVTQWMNQGHIYFFIPANYYNGYYSKWYPLATNESELIYHKKGKGPVVVEKKTLNEIFEEIRG